LDDGGLHVWVDLRDFLDTNSWDAEFRLWDALANTHGVLLVPGSLCGCYDPGFFRVAVAGEFETLREGLDRLERGIRRFVNDDTPHIGG
jgi:aspartate/methionine/tyrosine aminotransferase